MSSLRASTTGAACHRSRSITSIPERPWPELDAWSANRSRRKGLGRSPRAFIRSSCLEPHRWLDASLQRGRPRGSATRRAMHAPTTGCLARTGPFPSRGRNKSPTRPTRKRDRLTDIFDRGCHGRWLARSRHRRICSLRAATTFTEVCEAADALRAETCGDRVTYVVTRNINYTNICYFRCTFCAFSKGKPNEILRGQPYDLSLEEIRARCWKRGSAARSRCACKAAFIPTTRATTYLFDSAARSRALCPDIHVHAFSPLEVWQGAATLGIPVAEFLSRAQRCRTWLAARNRSRNSG